MWLSKNDMNLENQTKNFRDHFKSRIAMFSMYEKLLKYRNLL
jgi:hypothetical protein